MTLTQSVSAAILVVAVIIFFYYVGLVVFTTRMPPARDMWGAVVLILAALCVLIISTIIEQDHRSSQENAITAKTISAVYDIKVFGYHGGHTMTYVDLNKGLVCKADLIKYTGVDYLLRQGAECSELLRGLTVKP